jgi:alkylation response protein AidB-like acyl-CoA dehydrogenase
MGGVIRPEEFDHFHEVNLFYGCFPRMTEYRTSQLIINLELARCGTRGYVDGLLAGGVIGLPPVLNFGSPELQAKVVPEVLSGKKFICLAVSEAFAGSDVGGLQTVATMEGDEWIISGTKKCATLNLFIGDLIGRIMQMDYKWNVRGLFHSCL